MFFRIWFVACQSMLMEPNGFTVCEAISTGHYMAGLCIPGMALSMLCFPLVVAAELGGSCFFSFSRSFGGACLSKSLLWGSSFGW
ncbi:hypothetical protein YC2023_007607 [Brassica napus]